MQLNIENSKSVSKIYNTITLASLLVKLSFLILFNVIYEAIILIVKILTDSTYAMMRASRLLKFLCNYS